MATKQETLEKINAAIDSIMDGGAVQDYTVNGRSLRRYSLTELMELQKKYERDIAIKGAARSSFVRFDDAA